MTRSAAWLVSALGRLFFFKSLRTLLISAFALALSGTAASAGLLEDLFGPDPAPQAAAPTRAVRRATPVREAAPRRAVRSEVQFMPASRDRQERRDRHSTTVAKSDEGASSAGSRPIAASLCAPQGSLAGASAVSLLAYDKTLRNGDILVTDSGVQIFRGHAACPHDTHDFIALSTANMPKGKRSMLLAIEDAMKRPSGFLVSARTEKR
jgi:hypothetical protein